jgi:Arc/MetJ-type ribon-helix-helix transcriptional regulator
MDIDIALTGPEKEYVDQQIRSGRASSEGEVLREALQFMMDSEAAERRKYDAWRENARRRIEIGHQQCLDGNTVDGEAALERIRLALQERRRGT